MRTYALAFLVAIAAITTLASAQVRCSKSSGTNVRGGHFHGTFGPKGLTGHASYSIGAAPFGNDFSVSGLLQMHEIPCPGPNREFVGQWELTDSEVDRLNIPVGWTPGPGELPIPVVVTIYITIHENGNVFGKITVFGPGLDPNDPETRVYLL